MRLSSLREAIGDASEVAILKYMEILTGGVETYRKKFPKVFEVPFNSTNKYALTINESREEHGTWICMKGAPERILEKCSTIITKGREMPLDTRVKQQFQEAYEELGSLGERVIGKNPNDQAKGIGEVRGDICGIPSWTKIFWK